MTSSAEGAIVPVTLTVNGRIGLTLWAPPWEDEDGDEWQGFLGDGAKILMYPTTRALADFIASGDENDLSDHPGWSRVQRLTPDQLKPAGTSGYDLDNVYELAAGEPDPLTISALANVMEMVTNIADCCDDGKLRRLVEGTPEYADLVDEDVSYQGKEGRKAWNALGDTIADSWERAIKRVESWLSWQGDFEESDLEAEGLWDRVDAEPIEIVTSSGEYLTVRADTEPRKDEHEVVFLGTDDNVAVFTDVADLAAFCREGDDHTLVGVEGWDELAEATDDDFVPELDASYDLRKPSKRGAELVRELVAFCNLDADTSVLDGPTIDREDWRELLDEVETCFDVQE